MQGVSFNNDAELKAWLDEFFESTPGSKAAEGSHNICAVYGVGAIAERTAHDWYAKFKKGNFDLKDAPCYGRPVEFDEERLNQLLHENPRQTTRELAEKMECSHTAIEKNLHSMGKVQKCGAWVPHALTYNTSKHRSTKFSPHEVVFGFAMTSPFEVDTRKEEAVNDGVVTKLHGRLQRMRDLCKKNNEAAQKNQARGSVVKGKQWAYSVGDYVYMSDPCLKVGQVKKFHRPWKGPYRIKAVSSPCNVLLELPFCDLLVHNNRVKPYFGPIPPPNTGSREERRPGRPRKAMKSFTPEEVLLPLSSSFLDEVSGTPEDGDAASFSCVPDEDERDVEDDPVIRSPDCELEREEPAAEFEEEFLHPTSPLPQSSPYETRYRRALPPPVMHPYNLRLCGPLPHSPPPHLLPPCSTAVCSALMLSSNSVCLAIVLLSPFPPLSLPSGTWPQSL
ncbi:hypothetical protein J437_LFUL019245, partial [Ladona fulva]